MTEQWQQWQRKINELPKEDRLAFLGTLEALGLITRNRRQFTKAVSYLNLSDAVFDDIEARLRAGQGQFGHEGKTIANSFQVTGGPELVAFLALEDADVGMGERVRKDEIYFWLRSEWENITNPFPRDGQHRTHS